MALATVDEAQQRDDAAVGEAQALRARLLGRSGRLAPLHEVRARPRSAIGRDDAAQPLHLHLGVDDDAVGAAAQPAQAPGVRRAASAARRPSRSKMSWKRDDERARGRRAGSAAARYSGAAVLAPAAPVPLHEEHLRVGELGGHLRPAAAAPSSTRPASASRMARPGRRRAVVGDELPVAAHAALRPAQVQEAQVARARRRSSASAGRRPLGTSSVAVAEAPQQVARLGLDLGQLRGVEGAPPGAHRRVVGALRGRQEDGRARRSA